MGLTVECFVSKRVVCTYMKGCHIGMGLTPLQVVSELHKGTWKCILPGAIVATAHSLFTSHPNFREVSGDPSLPHVRAD